ncbi:MAG: methylmalonyl-CoA mutase [Alphaproteobacteria bacterium]|nr:methylmalonyl-CoA mutase [Alphaproteobacteria bacterium]
MSETSSNPRRALSRALSRIANADVAETLAQQGAVPTPEMSRIGVTGAPGAGKSTLIARLAKLRKGEDHKIAVLAIDPTSPVSKGSILGDRIRMDAIADDPNIFIRSIPSRRSHDGLADNTADLLAAMEGHGFDEVILESVGVGQAEYTIRTLVDTVVLVLLPESGDAIQAMKAGILEMADIYVVSKADLPGAELMVAEIQQVAERQTADGWAPPVISTSRNDLEGFARLDAAISAHAKWRKARMDETATQRARARYQAQGLIARRIDEIMEADNSLLDLDPRGLFDALIAKLNPSRRDA